MPKNDFKIYYKSVLILRLCLCQFAGQSCYWKIKLNHFILIGYHVL